MQRRGFAGNLTLAGEAGTLGTHLGPRDWPGSKETGGWGSEARELDSFQAAGGPMTLRGLTSGGGGLSPCWETRDPQGLGDLRLQSARKIRIRVGVGCLRDQQLAGTGGRAGPSWF